MLHATPKQINMIIVNWKEHPELYYQLLWKEIPETNKKYIEKYKGRKGDYREVIIRDYFELKLDIDTASKMIRALINRHHQNRHKFRTLLNSLKK